MSPESNPERDMRPEYDIRGGVRGKYLAEYTKMPTLTFDSEFVVTITASAPTSARIAPCVTYPLPNPSPKIHVGVEQPVDAG